MVLHTSSAPQGWLSPAAEHYLSSWATYPTSGLLRPHCRKRWWDCLTPEKTTSCPSHVQLGLLGPPSTDKGSSVSSDPRGRVWTWTETAQSHLQHPKPEPSFEVFFPSETQPGGKVRKPPHESWSETFRQDISPLECAGSWRCFVETV